MKMFGKKKSPATYDEKYLLQELMMTKKAMYTAYSNLDNVTDPDLIDCYIYQLNSEQKRYNYLLAKAKESQLSTSSSPCTLSSTSLRAERISTRVSRSVCRRVRSTVMPSFFGRFRSRSTRSYRSTPRSASAFSPS